jgi:hypothetical protein
LNLSRCRALLYAEMLKKRSQAQLTSPENRKDYLEIYEALRIGVKLMDKVLELAKERT